MTLNVPQLDLFLEFEVGRSYHRLRGELEGPLYPSDEFGHHARAKRIFEDAKVDKVVPDFCKTRVGKGFIKSKPRASNAVCFMKTLGASGYLRMAANSRTGMPASA